MAGMSERTRLMKDGFMELHNDGKTIPEIAAHFNLSTITIYRHLQEIADENGVSRESLLTVEHKPHNFSGERARRDKINPEKLNKQFEELSKKVDIIVVEISNVIGREENEKI